MVRQFVDLYGATLPTGQFTGLCYEINGEFRLAFIVSPDKSEIYLLLKDRGIEVYEYDDSITTAENLSRII